MDDATPGLPASGRPDLQICCDLYPEATAPHTHGKRLSLYQVARNSLRALRRDLCARSLQILIETRAKSLQRTRQGAYDTEHNSCTQVIRGASAA